MAIHELKTVQPFFGDLSFNGKNFEIRKNDRDFYPGDILILREWSPGQGRYVGGICVRKVVYILRTCEGLQDGWCCMTIKRVPDSIRKKILSNYENL